MKGNGGVFMLELVPLVVVSSKKTLTTCFFKKHTILGVRVEKAHPNSRTGRDCDVFCLWALS